MVSASGLSECCTLVVGTAPPLCSTIKLDCCSYAGRRIGSGVLGYMNASSILRIAFGNWKESKEIKQSGSAMPDNYTEHKLQLSRSETVALTVGHELSERFARHLVLHQTE